MKIVNTRILFFISLLLIGSCGGSEVTIPFQDAEDTKTGDADVWEAESFVKDSGNKDQKDVFDLTFDKENLDFFDTEAQVDGTDITDSVEVETAGEWCSSPGDFGCECNDDSDCKSGFCIPYKDGKICTQYCDEECPSGFSCKKIESNGPDTVFVCIYDFANLCKPCMSSGECYDKYNQNAVCVDYGNSGNFCGYECEKNSDCPDAYSCKEVTTIEGNTGKYCVPANDNECECNGYFAKEGFKTQCFKENEWGKCSGERKCVATDGGYKLSDCDAKEPEEEKCNNIDDNCNGMVDEDLKQAPEGVCKNEGVCKFGVKSQCINGEWICFYDEVENYQSGTELFCDGLDNDCDGLTDEDFDLELPDGTLVSGVNVDCGTGVCAGGKTQCTEDKMGIYCPTLANAGEEVCDGKDNNCNGETDEPEFIIVELCENQQGECAGAKHSKDECKNGLWEPCTPDDYKANDLNYEEVEETCDGLDNDCDGETDGNFTMTLPDGTQITGVGKKCGTGACSGGITVCTNDKKGITCSSLENASDEICDNVDNDCDGETDEGCDDDNDGYCDSNIPVIFINGVPPAVCPNSGENLSGYGDDCDDENSSIPGCEGKECGDNGCGGSCGTCGEGKVCHLGQCIIPEYYLQMEYTILPYQEISDSTYKVKSYFSNQKPHTPTGDGFYIIH